MKDKKMFFGVMIAIFIVILLFGGYFLMKRWVKKAYSVSTNESTDRLSNPDCGFYRIHGFSIQDDMDCEALLDKLSGDGDVSLSLIEMNLKAYRTGDLSEAALANIQTLLEGIAAADRHCILRFLYDWDGKNMETEPEHIHVIERHIEQLGPVINRYTDTIFLMQGLFIGNWGEMNGTRYTTKASLQTLANKLYSVTDKAIYLSVRMPKQWRSIIGSDDPALLEDEDSLAARLGLYNDGMMGSGTDLGTYGDQPRSSAAVDSTWRREDELAFQNQLCAKVPNGGEVVYDTAFNDFPHALEVMGFTHISYLNKEYDVQALDKWKNHTVSGQGIWDGMDGLTYVDRHLGYRYLIERSRLRWSFWNNTLDITAEVKNTGFAPIYHAARCALLFVSDGEVKHTIALDGDLRSLAGGRSQDKTLTFSTTLSMCDLPKADYQVYFKVTSEKYGSEIHLANKETVDGLGCLIGSIES